jgi:A/G-specific adenine glycosylase
MHELVTILPKKILYWYDNNKRILPWRIINRLQNKKEYYVLVSEFMLQQTRVKTVIPYFEKFVTKIPNLKVLSKSKEKNVLKLWEGLGYYRRVKNLHKTAKILVKNHNGRLPKKFEEIIKLPGIGKYTANSLSALVHNKPCIPIDGNVKRVFSRLFLTNASYKNFDNEIKKITNKLSYTHRNGDLAEALMEFGAVVCKPQNPLCKICNLKKYCKYFNNKNYILPNKKSLTKEKKLNIYCYLNKYKKEIALTKNKNLSFLNNFKMPKIQMVGTNNNSKKKGWNYLCKYKNNISNIKMDIDLFYRFTKSKPKKFNWYSVNKLNHEFIPSFTKKIITKIEKLY